MTLTTTVLSQQCCCEGIPCVFVSTRRASHMCFSVVSSGPLGLPWCAWFVCMLHVVHTGSTGSMIVVKGMCGVCRHRWSQADVEIVGRCHVRPCWRLLLRQQPLPQKRLSQLCSLGRQVLWDVRFKLKSLALCTAFASLHYVLYLHHTDDTSCMQPLL